MPELAEVEYFRRQWDAGLGQKILRVQLHARKRVFRGSNTHALVREITGSRFLRSESWGKQMLFEFSGGNWIGIHLGMTGKLRVELSGFRPEKHDHLVLHQTKRALVFRDARLFGRVRFHHGKFSPDWWRAGAPDITSAAFDGKFLDAFLAHHARAPVKAVLLLQKGFAGIGNWMADEILWRAKIAPLRLAGSLSSAERARLFR
ncbi:MAG TPA: DNA-formamidopyrimidine glycosylase family protein, partial [Chthoniobacterales bacterium]